MESFRVEETFLFALTRPLLLCIYRVRLGKARTAWSSWQKSAARKKSSLSKRSTWTTKKRGFPSRTIHEIKILQKLKHKNVVNLKEIVTSKAQKANDMKGSIYLVFEYMDHDLAVYADRPGMKFSEEQIKCYMKQLFQGLHYCHTNNILHRDIKGSNLLINNRGILKLADFGLARSYTAEEALIR